ncbi:hypothetical protein [Agaribacterium haliotis]|uniref:hypothetical protein n=1 Tax=Agaribacterium haliotis TaxID=2013869 RepID=UPI00117804DA|nr:hypothetical protein [Agaribacterium haliotis]
MALLSCTVLMLWPALSYDFTLHSHGLYLVQLVLVLLLMILVVSRPASEVVENQAQKLMLACAAFFPAAVLALIVALSGSMKIALLIAALSALMFVPALSLLINKNKQVLASTIYTRDVNSILLILFLLSFNYLQLDKLAAHLWLVSAAGFMLWPGRRSVFILCLLLLAVALGLVVYNEFFIKASSYY